MLLKEQKAYGNSWPMHLPKDLAVRATINELGLTTVARKMDLPTSTIFRWKSEDRIPGRGPAHQWRVAQFEAAVAALRAEHQQEGNR